MQYDERYTNRLATAGLDVISYQVRRGLPNYNIAAMTALIDRYQLYELVDIHSYFRLLMCI